MLFTLRTLKEKSFVYLSTCRGGPQKKLEKLQEIREKRLSQPEDSPHCMAEACSHIPDNLLPEHGYHQDCYQRFMNHTERLESYEGIQQARTSRRVRDTCTSEGIIFYLDCIFCIKFGRKEVKRKGY